MSPSRVTSERPAPSALQAGILPVVLLTLAVAALVPALLPAHAGAQEPVPPRMVADELERSRMCVPVLARLEALNSELEPLALRVNRIGRLYEAVALEDSMRVVPFDEASEDDRRVRDWFRADAELAERYLETEDEAVLEERRTRRGELEDELEEAFAAVSDQADAILGRDPALPGLAAQCDGAILVRPAVMERCPEGDGSRICAEARSGEAGEQYRFVDAAEDLWDVEQLRPWTSPSGIGPRPDGLLGGGQTSTLLRRGNVQLALALEPLIRVRDEIPAEEAAEYDRNLEEMGFQFDDPRFVMSPALLVELDMDQPLADETIYLLHFGDLSAPAEQVFWTAQADQERPIRDTFPVGEGVLVRLMSGEEVTLTAVRIDEEAEDLQGQPLYQLGLTNVGQAEAVTALVAYMAQGLLAQDLQSLFPLEEGTPEQ